MKWQGPFQLLTARWHTHLVSEWPQRCYKSPVQTSTIWSLFSTASAGFSMRVSCGHISLPLHKIKLFNTLFLPTFSLFRKAWIFHFMSHLWPSLIGNMGFSCNGKTEAKRSIISLNILLLKMTFCISWADSTSGVTSCPFRPCSSFDQSSLHYPLQPTVCFK